MKIPKQIHEVVTRSCVCWMVAVEMRTVCFQHFYKKLKVTLFLTMVLPLKYDETRYSRILQDLGENLKNQISH